MRQNQQESAQAGWVAGLCPGCGLCCNGVLFADVRLRAGDDALALERGGLRLHGGAGRRRFHQPCACFDGELCTIYTGRPQQCRRFDCHTLKQARAGTIDEAGAWARIRRAKAQADRVRALLRALGDRDEHLPLTRRYQAVMRRPVDLSAGDSDPDLRGELMLAVNDLMHRLQADFLA